jgi:hypothetical protein
VAALVVAVEIVMSDENAFEESDKTLAKTAWSLLWSRKTPILATLGVALTFTIRTFTCSYEDSSVPENLDFEWYGEHCGPGHGTDGEAIDELDAACKRHDAEYRKAKTP